MVINTMRRSPGPILRNCGKRPGQDRSRNPGKRNPLLTRKTSVGQILPIGSRTTPVMDDMIRALDDSQAVLVLTTFARVRLRAGGVAETEWTPELDRALRQDFPAEADAGRAGSVSEGDLARQALLLLADDPQNRDALAALIAGPPPESFEVVGAGTVALVAAMLMVLQTHVLFERDKDGKIHIKIEKKPTRDSLLKDLVQKLLGFFPPT